jgi:biopolymer transport protein ExbD/biopolymer transport protein TolR
MGMAAGGGKSGFVADINVTPMVDVMLVLLIIFMVVAPLLQSGVSVAVPKSKNPDLDDNIVKETSAVIAIPNDNEFYIGRDKMNAKEDIAAKVTSILKDKRPDEQIVYIKAGKLAKYGTVVDVIDILRNSDPPWERIGLVTEKEKTGAESEGSSQ